MISTQLIIPDNFRFEDRLPNICKDMHTYVYICLYAYMPKIQHNDNSVKLVEKVKKKVAKAHN